MHADGSQCGRVELNLFCRRERGDVVGTQVLTELGEWAAQAAAPSTSISVKEDDATLVAAAESGRQEAFEILVRRHQGKILRTALHFTRNREDAEDIVQQSLQKAYVHLEQFQGHSSFSTWLTRIAINEALMWLRRKRNSHEIAIDQSNAEQENAVALDVAYDGPSPEDSCLAQELNQILSAALERLTPGLRKAIELRELAELSTEDAARAMGLSVAAVKARIFHGRRKLQKTLKRWTSGNKRLRGARGRERFQGVPLRATRAVKRNGDDHDNDGADGGRLGALGIFVPGRSRR